MTYCGNQESNILDVTGNQESQVFESTSLPCNEEPNPIPELLVSSEQPYFTQHFLKREGFGTREELQAWCVSIGKAHNFQIICKSSQMKDTLGNGQGSRVQLCCERSGKHTSHRAKSYVPKTTTTKKRKCGSVKCNCPFRLNGSCDKYGKWKLRVGCGYHNHPLSTTLVGHGYAGRLEEKEKLEVEKLTNSGSRPWEILTNIKIDNPKNCSTMRAIYNARRKFKICAMQGRSMMQHFYKLALEHHYTVEYKYDPMTKKVTDLFFAHPVSVKLAQCFHEFLLLDCTYKTNKYRLPLFHVVSHTSTGATFTVAVAFMSREKEANYICALECVKRLYRGNEIPSVFVTDCEVGLIKAIDYVFPIHLIFFAHGI
ncbi:uncharacterized protein LOC113324269 [Papaver somniferum]|uniref:uncharacterized protein LOC113324269 n=1 Tax=Papaver somniferum TaxID=3469 RepID=UPI000E6FB35F|nr:uncharacterized protein LOC113324269 [Papaver somniferum]